MTDVETVRTDECAVPLLEEAPPTASAFKRHLKEAFRFCASATPVSVQCLNTSIFIAVIEMWVGHLSTAGLASVALGVQLNRALGTFLVQYLTSAMETIAGQAIGAKEYRLVGITFQRAILMCFVFLTPLAITAFHSERLLLLFHQDPDIASSVQEFLVISILGTLLQVLANTCIRYLSLNSYKWPIPFAQVMGFVVGLTTGAVLIKRPEGAVRGAALSTVAFGGALLPFSLVGVACLHRSTARGDEQKRIWHGFSRAAFQGWGHYLQVGGGAVLMFLPKQFFMEYLFIITGTLDRSASTAIAVSMLWVVTTNGMAVGFNLAAMARIGRAIGSGNLGLAKFRVRTYWFVALVISSILGATLMIFEKGISRLWTRDPQVLRLLHQLKWSASVSILFSWMGMISLGILGGFRRHFLGAFVAIPSYLILGFGMAPVLIICLGWGTLGASLSYTSVVVCETAVLAILLCSVNYQEEHARVGESLRLSLPVEE